MTSTSVTDTRRTTTKIVGLGITAIIAVLILCGAWLLWSLPDANAFNDRVAQLFANTDGLDSQAEIKLLEILAQSGTTFADTLANYRMVIFVLMLFATALLLSALVFLVMLIALNRRMAQIEASGLQVSSLLISREENLVILNNMEFKLTDAAMETISTLAEARMDGDVLSGSALEGLISGKREVDCDEAAGATRVKRLRDGLGNQMVSHLLVKNVSRKGYMLAIDKDVIEMI